jgi:hypothetical protein
VTRDGLVVAELDFLFFRFSRDGVRRESHLEDLLPGKALLDQVDGRFNKLNGFGVEVGVVGILGQGENNQKVK